MLDRASQNINENENRFPSFVEIKYTILREDVIEVKTFGDLIKKKRLELGLTQKELAKKLYVSQEIVYLWERRHGKPNDENLKKLNKILRISNTDINRFL